MSLRRFGLSDLLSPLGFYIIAAGDGIIHCKPSGLVKHLFDRSEVMVMRIFEEWRFSFLCERWFDVNKIGGECKKYAE